MIRINAFFISLIVISTVGCGNGKEFAAADDNSKKHLRNLRSLNEYKRSNAAVALFEMQHPKALDACIRTIDDAPDFLHIDYTPSMNCLDQFGESALLRLVDLFLSKNEMTRLRASHVMWKITFEMYKVSKASETYNQHEIQDQLIMFWGEISLDYEATLVDRKEGIKKFKEWLKKDKWV